MPVVLDCASWGIVDPRQLGWLDPPSPAAISEAKARLQAIGALTDDGRITPHGRALAAIPLPVPLAHMILDAARAGEAETAGRLARSEERRVGKERGSTCRLRWAPDP